MVERGESEGVETLITICHRCKRDRGRFWFVLCIGNHDANMADYGTRVK